MTPADATEIVAGAFINAATLRDFRRSFEVLSDNLQALRCAPDFAWRRVEGVDVATLRGPASSDREVLYLHGGGFVAGSPVTHRHVASGLAAALSATVHIPDYPLAPESGLAQTVAVIRCVAEALGCPIVAADSAGGRLAIELVAPQRGPIDAVLLISPWLDITRCGRTHDNHDRSDGVVSSLGLAWAAGHFDEPPHPPSTELSLPPTLVQVGASEILADDAHQLAANASVVLELYDSVPHVWHQFHGLLTEADMAFASMTRFVSGLT
jgi:epsilon-lactone hydrolase